MQIRPLERSELKDVWSIDRSERIERMYGLGPGGLELREEHHELSGWPIGEADEYHPLLLDCFDRGGVCLGAFDRSHRLVGAVFLESRRIGAGRDTLQLTFLHVDRAHRDTGVGGRLFDHACEAARALGARCLYVSATPSENTIDFYRRRGFTPTSAPDPELFAREPEDIHMTLSLAP